MAPNPRSTTADDTAAPPAFFDPGATNAAIESWLRMQQQQLDTLMAWQRSLADMQQDLWDQWVSHWGGGVPLDG
jgi:hypothetical protein